MSKKKKTPKEFCEDLVKKDFRFFKDVYDSEKEMLEYCLKFQKIHKPLWRAFEEFFSLSEFYRAMKMMKNDFIKLLMITSLIEKLSSKKDFTEFSEWVSEKEKEGMLEGKRIQKIWEEYNEDFGCSGKFRRFFLNPEYLSKKEQITLLKSICYFLRNDDSSIFLVPLFCYSKKVCGLKDHGCEYESYTECSAFREEKILKKGIKEFANFLYNLRNKFIHDAHLFGLSSEIMGTTSFSLYYVPYKFRYIKRPSYKRRVVIRLSGKKLEEILNRNLKKLLNTYIAMRETP